MFKLNCPVSSAYWAILQLPGYQKIDDQSHIHTKQARKPQSSASPKLQSTDRLTGVECRATNNHSLKWNKIFLRHEIKKGLRTDHKFMSNIQELITQALHIIEISSPLSPLIDVRLAKAMVW